MHRHRLAAVPLALIALSACGTTVPLTEQSASAGGALLTTAPGRGAAQAGAASTAPQALSTGGSNVAMSATRSGVPQAMATTPVAGLPPVQGTVRDTTPVRVGIELIKGGNEALAAAFPGTSVAFGDGKLEATAVVNDVNAHGGIAGRKIVPVFGEINVADGEAGREAACQSMTEDGKAVFILAILNISTAEVACAAKHKVPLINTSFGAGDLGLYKQYPGILYSPSLMNLNRELQLVLDSLRETGRISANVRVGVLIDGQDTQYQRVDDATVEPRLKAWGIPHTVYAAKNSADISGAILRFKTDGVKLVVFIAPSGIGEVLFMQQAEQQAYRPQYAIGDSASGYFINGNAPKEQIKGVFGAGSLPISNVAVNQYPTTPQEKHCLDVIAKAGETNANRRTSLTATIYCEAIYQLAAVGERVVGPLTGAAFRAAYSSVGTSFQPTTTFRMDFANGRQDNAAAYRLFGYRPQCSCIGYLGPLRPLTE